MEVLTIVDEILGADTGWIDCTTRLHTALCRILQHHLAVLMKLWTKICIYATGRLGCMLGFKGLASYDNRKAAMRYLR